MIVLKIDVHVQWTSFESQNLHSLPGACHASALLQCLTILISPCNYYNVYYYYYYYYVTMVICISFHGVHAPPMHVIIAISRFVCENALENYNRSG